MRVIYFLARAPPFGLMEKEVQALILTKYNAEVKPNGNRSRQLYVFFDMRITKLAGLV